MARFLVDENLSPLIAEALRSFGYDAKAVRELGMMGCSDEGIIQLAAKEGWIIVTQDIEFGELFYRNAGRVSVLILRCKSQGMSGFMDVLRYLHLANVLKVLNSSGHLALASANRHRIRKFSLT